MKKITRWMLITITLLMNCVAMTSIGQTSSTIVAVNPSVVADLDPGQTFDINITVANVNDLYGWGFNMTFNINVLEVTNVQKGPFLETTESTIFTWQKGNVTGWVMLAELFIPPLPPNGTSGSGVLATITFEVKGSGETSLHFVDKKSYLTRVVYTSTVLIDHTTTDGLFRNVVPQIISLEMIIAIIAVVAIVGSIAVILYRRRRAET